MEGSNAIADALKTIYRAKDAAASRQPLAEFDAGPWGKNSSAIAQIWRRNWEHVVPFYAFPGAVQRIIYATNAIEALNAKLRRVVTTRGHFPPFGKLMRRGRDEIVVSCLAPGRGKIENAAPRMVRGEDPIRHHIRRKVRCGVIVNLAPHTKFLAEPMNFAAAPGVLLLRAYYVMPALQPKGGAL